MYTRPQVKNMAILQGFFFMLWPRIYVHQPQSTGMLLLMHNQFGCNHALPKAHTQVQTTHTHLQLGAGIMCIETVTFATFAKVCEGQTWIPRPSL